jgi:deoxyribodipyrimidine photo-lyase
MKHAEIDHSAFPASRLHLASDRPPRADGDYVVYWMTAARRTQWNFAFQRAADWAAELKRPLVVVEVLACAGRWDCDRFHHFALDGMADNARQLAARAALYYPYIEPKAGDARKLFRAVADRACLIVTDDYPIALPAVRTVDKIARTRIEAIDGNGLLPLRAADKAFSTARSFRRFLQATLREFMFDAPQINPLVRRRIPRLESLPAEIVCRWPPAESNRLSGNFDLASLPIDHRVGPVPVRGGAHAARTAWQQFLHGKLTGYADDRNQPEADACSRLSPYLHFGHISVHEVLRDLLEAEKWDPHRLPDRPNGKSEGWWGMSRAAEAFLDQIVTWRELSFNACLRLRDYDTYDSLPEWAQATLAKHAGDARPDVYTLDQFAAAATHDVLWNAAQRQLLVEGRIHNYLRMIWGKKVLQCSATPHEAWDALIELNNRYALDGQDPNSYTGIAWIFGRYDRPWAPERPIFGRVRYMSCENTARKLRVKGYVQTYSSPLPPRDG